MNLSDYSSNRRLFSRKIDTLNRGVYNLRVFCFARVLTSKLNRSDEKENFYLHCECMEDEVDGNSTTLFEYNKK